MTMRDLNKRLLRKILVQSIRNLDEDMTSTKPNILKTVAKNEKIEECKQTQENEHGVEKEQGDHNEQDAEEQESRIVPSNSHHNQITAENPSTSHVTANDQEVCNECIGDQSNGTPVGQRSPTTLDSTGTYHLLALLLPLCGINSFLQLPCNARNLFDAVQIILAQAARYYAQVRVQVRRLTDEDLANNLFAALMDIVLVLYAIGFLILSVYQAAVFR